ncbi:hypothetical protein WOLCODRAFT_136965 [Wolfiporia cocos MD-104 SS10]|uniref:PH-domain-containing protein n=1 Tax=Wolfiporia cocos (strain MD-104) TaxID=742152 RepID=A0A2H3JGS5_WOLCO|nr:hypothetical protein WOLCODRAFT_136965 [Wolfiporia cocos MD-104 SS10]
MPVEYVYVVHEFTPENPDEVALRPGERIEVVEKDDLYGDGWWQGRNAAGQVGLFPQSYTSPHPPATLTASGSNNASSASSTVEGAPPNNDILSASGRADPVLSRSTEDMSASVYGSSVSENGVMRATMTDVQQAIEQLGRGGDDGARSFSFASTRSRSTDHSESEVGDTDRDEDDGNGGFGWSKGARTKLAMRAQQANEEREARERSARTSVGPSTPMRTVAPPIDVEMSDESEDESEDEHARAHPRIPEADEEEFNPPPTAPLPTKRFSPAHSRSATIDLAMPVITVTEQSQGTGQSLRTRRSRDSATNIIPSEEFIVPSPGRDETELPTARAERETFSAEQPSTSTSVGEDKRSTPSMQVSEASPAGEADITSPTSPPIGGVALIEKTTSTASSTLTTSSAFLSPTASVSPSAFSSPTASASALSMPQIISPTPTPSTVRVAEAATNQPLSPTMSSGLPSPSASSFVGSMSMSSASAGMRQAMTPATTMSAKSLSGAESGSGSASGQVTIEGKRPDGHPSEWTVEQVVEWLRSKNFDQDVCDKFIEQEITGDVLLELDANLLKTEIGIAAFGKRARIVNAIAELRRPPSLFESPTHTPARVTTPRSQTGQSLQYTHSHSASMQSSAATQSSAWGYPNQYAPNPQGYSGSPGRGSAMSAESPPMSGDMALRNGWPVHDGEFAGDFDKEKAIVGLGLGLQPSPPVNGKDPKPRPANLVLSPSDGAIGATAIGPDAPSTGEDRGAMSEGETMSTDSKSKSRRLFWRGDAASIKDKSSGHETTSRNSKDTKDKEPGTPQSLPSASTAVSTPDSPSELKAEGAEDSAVSVTRRASKKRDGADPRKASDRLSLFGGTFTGTLGKSAKSRKPPPKITTSPEKAEAEKHPHHHMSFSRIREKRSSSRPSTADGTAKEKKVQQFPTLQEVQESPEKGKEPEKSSVLRKRTVSTLGMPKSENADSVQGPIVPKLKPGQSILEQIGTPDHEGWMRKKGDRYNNWKTRYFVLKGPHLYCLRSQSKSESKIKGYINIVGYKVIADENVDPGRYGFRIVHDSDKTHYFSSDEQLVIREWMKALMKATITRDYADLVVSSCNIPTIPLTVAQAMNPAPRPPSPAARAATQRAMRPENPNQLTQRDAQVLLMGVQGKDKGTLTVERARLDSFFTNDTISSNGSAEPSPRLGVAKVPPRPSREMRKLTSTSESQMSADDGLIEWANSHLPTSLQVPDPSGPLYGGLALLRMAEDIKGKPSSPRVPDSAFPSGPDDDKLDGLFRLFDFLLDNDVKMGTVSINDIRQGKRDKVVLLLRSLKAWEDKRKAIAQSLGPGSPPVGAYMALEGPINYGSKS